MKVLASACIIFTVCIAASLQTPFNPCDDGPTPLSLRVEGCNTFPCKFVKGTDIIAQWDFIANADAKSLEPRVKVIIMGMTIPYPYDKDACKSLSKGSCPLSKGDEVTYNFEMFISSTYPPVSLTIEFALLDENKNVQMCFQMDGKVTKYRKYLY